MNRYQAFPDVNLQRDFNPRPTLPQLHQPFIYQHPSPCTTPNPPPEPMRLTNPVAFPLTGSRHTLRYVQPEIQWTRHSLGENIAFQQRRPPRSNRRRRKINRRASIARHRDELHAAYTNATYPRQPKFDPRLMGNAPHVSFGPEYQAQTIYPFDELSTQPSKEPPYRPVPQQPGQPLEDEPNTSLTLSTETMPTAWYDVDPWLEVEVPIKPVMMDAEIEELKRIMLLVEADDAVQASDDAEIRSSHSENSGCW